MIEEKNDSGEILEPEDTKLNELLRSNPDLLKAFDRKVSRSISKHSEKIKGKVKDEALNELDENYVNRLKTLESQEMILKEKERALELSLEHGLPLGLGQRLAGVNAVETKKNFSEMAAFLKDKSEREFKAVMGANSFIPGAGGNNPNPRNPQEFGKYIKLHPDTDVEHFRKTNQIRPFKGGR
jgi:hypothetical protein